MKKLWKLTLLTGFINLGLVARDLALAYRLGTSVELNEFLLCTILPIFAITFLTANLPILLVPRLIGVNATVMSRYLRMFSLFTLLATIVLILLTSVLGQFVEAWWFMNTSTQMLLWAYFGISTFAAIFRCLHNASESYVQPLIANLLGSTFTALMFWNFAAEGKTLLAITYVAGALVELCFVSWGYRRVVVTAPADYPTSSWKTRFTEALPLLITGLLIPIGPMVDQIFAGSLDPKGLSFLLYAGKFWGLAMGTMGTVIGTVALTEFSKEVANNSSEKIDRMLKRGSAMLFAIGLVSSALIWMLSPILVPLVLERGEFTSADSAAVTEIVRFGIWILPPYFVAYYLKRYLMALRINKIITIIYGSNIILNAVADLILSRHFGIAGIALSSAVVQTWSVLWIIYAINKLRRSPTPNVLA